MDETMKRNKNRQKNEMVSGTVYFERGFSWYMLLKSFS